MYNRKLQKELEKLIEQYPTDNQIKLDMEALLVKVKTEILSNPSVNYHVNKNVRVAISDEEMIIKKLRMI